MLAVEPRLTVEPAYSGTAGASGRVSHDNHAAFGAMVDNEDLKTRGLLVGCLGFVLKTAVSMSIMY